jgi:subtilisin-like proprotein convertase family protein
MAAANYNFSIEQGSDFEITFQYLDTNGNGIDLTENCILLRARRSDNPNLIYRFNSNCSPKYDINDGDTNCLFPTLSELPWYSSTNFTNKFLYELGTDRQNGNIVWKLSSSVTSALTCDSLLYELDIIDNSNPNYPKNIRLATGTITINKRNFSVVYDCANVADSTGTTDITPTPTVTAAPAPVNLCLPEDCLTLDIYSKVYTGATLSLNDKNINSDTIHISDTGTVTNIEVAFNGLTHPNPQDLMALLVPPSGNSILLFANSRMINYAPGFSFMISNKAHSDSTVNNVVHGGLCGILDKTGITKFNNQILSASFNHLFNHSPSGDWTLYVNDSDWIYATESDTPGTIDSWKLILTYAEN